MYLITTRFTINNLFKRALCIFKPMQFKKVTHVLFDLDGLLIDSESIYAEAYMAVCAKYGKVFTWEMNSTLQGRKGPEVADRICEALSLPVDSEEFMRQYGEFAKEKLVNVKLMPGAFKLVEHLHKHHIPIAMATSSSQDSVDLKMQNHKEFLSLFDHITMGNSDPEVHTGKPHPIIFQVCASRFPDKPKHENCLVFEDAYNGVLAALAAKMQVVAVPHPKIDLALMKDATLVLKSLEDVQPELFGLPPYDS